MSANDLTSVRCLAVCASGERCLAVGAHAQTTSLRSLWKTRSSREGAVVFRGTWGVTVGLGDRAEFVGRGCLRFLAGDESGFGRGARFGEQGQWGGAAFDRARFHAIRAVADAM